MRKRTGGVGALMLLAACGGGASDVAQGNTASAADANASGDVVAAAAAPAAAVAPARPVPGEVKTFSDWAVGCDNLGTCKAAALAPEGEEFPAVLMSITRAAGPNGALSVAFLSSEAIPLPLRVAVDGRPAGEGGRTDDDATRIEGEEAARIVAAAASGKTLSVSDGGNAATSDISLAGLSAALRYIDDRQGRAGTTGALVARGNAPDTRAAPTAPVLTLAAPGGGAAAPSAQQLAEFRKAGECDVDMASNGAAAPETHALGGGKTLLLLPCSMGAYNVMALVYVGDTAGFRPAGFDAPTGMGEEGGVPSVVNGAWENGLLESYDKGRGLGDCGVSASWGWDGAGFRLVEQAVMPECRGNIDFIRTWHAEVRR
ncbi:DUF1176 domain-containing protein [Sphingomonas parva]|uniref:DUF1176 domain-containing protein n=1 Tax=Sphingomonas parva TaxID=2555898 RepID=A0A4Y8ZUY0_9SPHN|nr:DUF1176 domain-containing protein [Sphingomonas parva]TFI59287.1 DUF1176 domain-containing protein [Sphingomonas parva]